MVSKSPFIQEELFHEDVYDALKTCVKAMGGAKKVGTAMRPELPMDQARTWLDNCLDRNRKDKLDLEQVVWILRQARRANCHVGMYYLADEAGYQRPLTVEPEDEMARLQREYVEAARTIKRIAERIERVQVKVAG